MSEHVDEQQVRRIAKLAKLALTDDEVRVFAPQLSQVLTYVARLESIESPDSEDVRDGSTNRLADDEPGAMLENQDLIRIAPSVDGPFIRVPKVIDDGGSS